MDLDQARAYVREHPGWDEHRAAVPCEPRCFTGVALTESGRDRAG